MDLTYFPMDTQQCNLIFESYSYNTAEVRIEWRDWEPVSIPDPNSKNLPDFELVEFLHKNTTLVYTAGIQSFIVSVTFIVFTKACGISSKQCSSFDDYTATMFCRYVSNLIKILFFFNFPGLHAYISQCGKSILMLKSTRHMLQFISWIAFWIDTVSVK
jgi:hypothetical protein